MTREAQFSWTIIATIQLFIFSFLIHAESLNAQGNYTQQWERAQRLEAAGLPRQALALADSIHAQAIKESNDPQRVKAVIQRMRYMSAFEEDHHLSSILFLEGEINSTYPPLQQIFQSILAEVYWRYLRDDMYRILERSQMEDPGDNPAFWDARTFSTRIKSLYLNSLEPSAVLFAHPVRKYSVILDTAEGSAVIRPTLYDLLLHRAMDFLTNEDARLGQAIEAPLPLNPEYFAKGRRFQSLSLPSSERHETLILSLYQQALILHERTNLPDSRVELDLERFQYLQGIYGNAMGDSLFRQALLGLLETHRDESVSVGISWRLAQDYIRSGSAYEPLKGTQGKWDRKTALALCESAIERFPHAFYTPHCRHLISEILKPGLWISLQQVVPADKEFLALLKYQNQTHVRVKMIPIDPEEDRQLRQFSGMDDILKRYQNMPSKATWELTLRNDNDYQAHSIEIPLPALERGYYVMLCHAIDNNGSDNLNIVTSGGFWVSNIAYTTRQMEYGGLEILVSDRNQGKPLESAIISVHYRQYDHRARKLNLIPGPVVYTDEDGFASLQLKDQNYAHSPASLSIKYKNDLLSTDEAYYLHAGEKPMPEAGLQCFLFSDRSIYRPGQIIYFKGILISGDRIHHQLEKKKSVKMQLLDANGSLVAEQTFVTGEYGSFHGSFSAPVATMPGECSLVCEHGQLSFRVEEYKRPKFDIRFEPVEGAIRIGDQVAVKGEAIGYAGNPMGGAKVRYRIERSSWFPYPWYGDWGRRPMGMAKMLTSGETKCKDDGSFVIEFQALGDNQGERPYKPVYHFTLYVDVVDISGETQERRTSLNIGYQSLIIHSEIPHRINKHSSHSYRVSAKNNQGQAVDVVMDLRISKLQEPLRLLRTRLWEQPDFPYLDSMSFTQRFPLDPWGTETDPLQWEKIEPMRHQTYLSGKDTLLNLNTLTALPEGIYLIELSCVDQYGDTIERQDVIEVYSLTKTSPLFNKPFWAHLTHEEAQPGDKVNLILSSARTESQVWVEITNKNGLKQGSWQKVGRATRAISIPISNEDKGNILIRCHGILDNRTWMSEHTLLIEDRDLILDVKFERFRTLLEPGQSEEWQLHFSDKDANPAIPELLISMYDASLDVINPHSWSFYLPKREAFRIPWNSSSSMGIRQGFSLETNRHFSEPLRYQEYDKLNWFGMDYYFGGYGRGMKMSLMVDDAMAMRMLSSRKEAKTESEGTTPAENEASTQAWEPSVPQPTPSSISMIRRNFGETAFFFPALQANRNGDIIVRFNAPEAVTSWNILGLAHTLGLSHTSFQKTLITAKELMLIPNLPRLIYEGDEILIKAKVANTGKDTLAGHGILEIEDAITGTSLNIALDIQALQSSFQVLPGSSDTLVWRIQIPSPFTSLLRLRIKASTEDLADGEEHLIPVLSARVLITETMPLFLAGKGKKKWDFDIIPRSLADPGIIGHQMSLEYTMQPAWNVVKAIPSLLGSEGHSAQQIFTRVFANSLAYHIITKQPQISEVIRIWATQQPDALESELSKNPDLKALVLEQTPWVRDAAGEAATRRQLALFLDQNTIILSMEKDAATLCSLQLPSGAWPWFPGMPASRHMTQQILTGIGKLKTYEAASKHTSCLKNSAQQATQWVLGSLVDDLEFLKRTEKDSWEKHAPNPIQVQALYALSFFIDENKLQGKEAEAWKFFFARASETWVRLPLHLQAMYGMASLRTARHEDAKKVLLSIRDRALTDVDGSMYWKTGPEGYRWYESSIETQAALITLFSEGNAPQEEINAMKIWLLRNKQLNHWETSTATAEACYAMLYMGKDWIGKPSGLSIRIGDIIIEPDKKPDLKKEAGSGYFRVDFPASQVTQNMGKVEVTSSQDSPSWGAVYWQYFQDMQDIRQGQGGMVLRKTMTLVQETGQGQTLRPFSPDLAIQMGDRIRIRLEIETEKEMEYIHLQDHRPASMERTEQSSTYRYKGGLAYYESIRDHGTDFFFEALPKGRHILEYDLFVTQEGSFTSGPARIQSLYAPSYSAHTQGQRIRIGR